MGLPAKLTGVALIAGVLAACSSALLPTGVQPLTPHDYVQPTVHTNAKVELGRLLFFDKILSGNKNIACATCHHPAHGTGDGLALPIGEGGIGLGPKRKVDRRQPVLDRVPRNSPPLYFAGAKNIHTMFHDGRVTIDRKGRYKSGFVSPAADRLPAGLDSVLAVQAMFPVLSDREMAGQRGENKIATTAALKKGNWENRAWELIARRLREIPEYVDLFKRASPNIHKADDITYVHAANAIAAFERQAFKADNSPFDKYLRTQSKQHLTPAARRGLDLFYGRAKCSSCHSGPLQTDQKFHAIAMPQIGPGKGHGHNKTYMKASGFDAYLEDEGRYAITKNKADLFKFRTPSLRNVELTAPYGHSGAYATLAEIVRHHANPVEQLRSYDVASVNHPALGAIVIDASSDTRAKFQRLTRAKRAAFAKRDAWVQKTPVLRDRIAAANELPQTSLSDQDVADLVAFLKALTDPRSRNQLNLVPKRVPSGLPVDD